MTRIFDEMDRGFRRLMGEHMPQEPVVTIDYPHQVTPAAGDQFLTDNDATPLFFDDCIGNWERPLCAQLDPTKRYRLELRFFEVDE